jgi:serine/threonine protein kinase
MSVPRRLGYSPAPQHHTLADRSTQQSSHVDNNNSISGNYSSDSSASPRPPVLLNNSNSSPSASPGGRYSIKSGVSDRLQFLTPLRAHMRKQGSQDGSMMESEAANSSTAQQAATAVAILSGSHSPKSMSQLLYSPKPSPGMRVSVPSPAPQAQTAPQSYATLPALERSHRYVITGTLQQSLFGVVKLAFDRFLKLQVAIKISRRERAQQQTTRSGVSVLENVKREAAVMQYLADRSASAQALQHGINSLTVNGQSITLSQPINTSTYSQSDSSTNNYHNKSNKRMSSRAFQGEKAKNESETAQNSMEDDLEITKSSNNNSSQQANFQQFSQNVNSSPDSSDLNSSDAEFDSGQKYEIDLFDLEGEIYICKFIEEFEDEYFHYLINEFISAGDLYSTLTSFPDHRLTEPQARGLFRQIVLGTRYLHARNLAHLDMSLENICLDGQENVKIIDFGVAALHPYTPTTWQTTYFQYTSANSQLVDFSAANLPQTGTAGGQKSFMCKPVTQLHNKPGKIRYMSPELFSGAAWDAFANDVFSLGVILYSLLTGRPPFQQADNSDVWFNVIYSGQWLTQAIKKQPSAHVYTHLSNEALDLINKIIKPQEQRLTLDQILANPWMNIKDF